MKAPAFKPHFNRSMGRYYHTSADYYGDLKSKGMIPYNPADAKPPERKGYTQSTWAKEMLKTIKTASKDSKGRPILGGRFHEELEKRGVSLRKNKRDSRLNPNEGGVFSD